MASSLRAALAEEEGEEEAWRVYTYTRTERESYVCERERERERARERESEREGERECVSVCVRVGRSYIRMIHTYIHARTHTYV